MEENKNNVTFTEGMHVDRNFSCTSNGRDHFLTAFKPKPQMSRTIMAEPRSNPWASLDNSPTRGDARFNPNTTGFSMLTSHLDRISSLGTVDPKKMKDL